MFLLCIGLELLKCFIEKPIAYLFWSISFAFMLNLYFIRLEKKIKQKQGIIKIDNIFLATYNSDGSLSVYLTNNTKND